MGVAFTNRSECSTNHIEREDTNLAFEEVGEGADQNNGNCSSDWSILKKQYSGCRLYKKTKEELKKQIGVHSVKHTRKQ